MKTIWKIIWLVSLVYLLVLMGLSYSDLPEKIASHFDMQGMPDGWSGKNTFYTIMLPIIIFVNLLPLFIGWLIDKAPKLVNMPNKEYWLSTEERKKTVKDMMNNMMILITALLNVLFIIAFQYTYDVNILGAARFNIFWIFAPTAGIIIIPIYYIIKMSKSK